jgi:hypothetical protein
MGSAIVFFNQLCGGGALATFANVSFTSVFSHDKDDILSFYAYLNLVQVIVTLFAGQFL